MSTEIVPSDNLWMSDDDFDGAYIHYSFVTINRVNQEIVFDLRQKHKHHVYNQDSGGRKLWEILLDSHSTCDVIINKAFLLRIPNSKWTLRLQRKDQYHRTTAKILWLSQLATGYHCTRVQKPTEEDWEKLIQSLA